MSDTRYIEITTNELSELISYSAESGEPICATIGSGHLIAAETGEKTLRKLAEMRGIELDKNDTN